VKRRVWSKEIMESLAYSNGDSQQPPLILTGAPKDPAFHGRE
jgi:hypothetical protein